MSLPKTLPAELKTFLDTAPMNPLQPLSTASTVTASVVPAPVVTPIEPVVASSSRASGSMPTKVPISKSSSQDNKNVKWKFVVYSLFELSFNIVYGIDMHCFR